jgi:hypothetical protein
MAFLLGRLIDIQVTDQIQEQYYNQVAIAGDLDDEDLVRAKMHANATRNFLFTWVSSPCRPGEQGTLVVKLQWEGQDVYFSEISHDLLSGSTGQGSLLASEDDDNSLAREGLRDVPGTTDNAQTMSSSATLVR